MLFIFMFRPKQQDLLTPGSVVLTLDGEVTKVCGSPMCLDWIR